ncbi:MAG: glycosyltransferase family 4 protein [Dysgonamonadaceae bacterium]|jgi:glycosyltransferase involved in cell wall biosynthesis|nr:glycosyltransferase family 4 protein [Dysgonamonadaceae bacterium]
MRIGFDAKRAVQNNTGLGNYSRFVIEILSEYEPDNTYFLFAPKRKENKRLKTLISRPNVFFIFPSGFSKLLSLFWRFFGSKKIDKNRMEIFHGLSNELPVNIYDTGVKTVVTIHDLIFIRYPQYYHWLDRKIYCWKFKRACQKAGVIIAVSECTKRDIISFFHIPEEKIRVIYQGCHPIFKQRVPEEKRKRIVEEQQFPERFILYVGSIESRKNLLLAVKALKQIPEDIHLVAIGKSTPYQLEIEKYAHEMGLESRLCIKNDFPFENFPAVYQSASVFVYPSFFEGFGIPVIEALSCGVPVIAATGSCLEESGGPDSVYVNPYDETELAAKIREILENQDLAEKMAARGLEYMKRFDSQRIVAEIMDIYRELL